VARPDQVRRVILASVPVFDAKERETYNSRPWPSAPARTARTSSRSGSGSVVRVNAPLARLGEDLGTALRAGDSAAWGPAAAANYPAGERLRCCASRRLVLRPKDEFWDMTVRSDGLLPEARRVDLEGHNGGLFDTGAADVARYAREFLDR